MDSNLDKIAQDLYGKIQTRFRDITMGDENANVLSKKEDIPKARFFEFEYREGGVALGTITITLDAQDGIVIQVSGDLVDDDNNLSGQGAYKFIRGFRQFAKDRLLNFDVQNIGKSNLDKRDYEFQAKRKEEPAMPAIMENKLYGNARMSYQDLGEARLVIKHSQPVNPDLPAGRTMHIESIYIENAQGERFKYPFKHLNGARALAEHIKHGGIPYDAIGKHIVGLSEELAGLRKFKGYVSRQEQLSEAMANVTVRVAERIEEIKETISKLQRPAYYETFAESFTEHEDVIIPEELQNDLIDRLTIRTFNEELKSVFPYIAKFVNEDELPVIEVGASDILGSEVTDDDQYDRDYNETIQPEDEFESFLEDLINEDKDELFSPNPQAQQAAITKLNQVIAQDLDVGPNGDNGLLSVKGLIDKPDFVELVKSSPAEMKLNDLIKGYLATGYDNLVSKLDFEGTAQAANPTAAPAEMPATQPTATEPTATAEPTPTPAQAEVPAEPAPVAEGKKDDELPFEPDAKPAGKTTPGKHGQGYSQARHLARQGMAKAIEKAKKAGATLETQLDFGSGIMTVAEMIESCGMMPQEFGFEPKVVDGEGIPAMIKYIAGFYNKEEGNFPLGGMRVKIKVKKAAEDGEFGSVSPEEVAKVIQFIDAKDPSGNEHNQIMRLAGVKKETQPDLGFDISTLETQLDSMSLQFNEAVLRDRYGNPVVDGSGKVVGTGSSTPQELAAAQAEVEKKKQGIFAQNQPPQQRYRSIANTNPAPEPVPVNPPTTGPNVAPAPAPAPAPADGPAPQNGPLGVQSQAQGAFGAPAPVADKPNPPPATSVNDQGQNVTMPDGTNPETGNRNYVPDAAKGGALGPADNAPTPTTPAAPKNRDSMTFGQAFNDARKSGEQTFPWRGKKYGTQLAKPKPQQSGKPAAPATVAPGAVDISQPEYGTGHTFGLSSESVGYSEDQNLASIVHLAGLR